MTNEEAVSILEKMWAEVEYYEETEALDMAIEALTAHHTGNWIKFADYTNNLNQARASMTCSECDEFFDGYPEIKEWNYCPHCGARMDGGTE